MQVSLCTIVLDTSFTVGNKQYAIYYDDANNKKANDRDTVCPVGFEMASIDCEELSNAIRTVAINMNWPTGLQ